MSQEKGSMAVFVGIVLLGMLFVVMSVFLISNNSLQAQAESVIKIKEAYESDVNNVDEIYENITGTSTEEPGEDTEYATRGLILHYDAINNTGEGHSSTTTTWKDLSGNGNDGVITGGTWQGNALNFSTSNSTNGVKTSKNFPINYTNTFNIVFNLNKVQEVDPLIGSRTSYDDGFMLFNYKTNNEFDVDIKGGDSRIKLGNLLSSNTIYDITVTFENGMLKYYMNGQLLKTTSYTPQNINLPLTIFTAGARNNSIGDIYSVKVYNRALTDSEILKNYNTDKEKYQKEYVTDGLLLYYDALNNTGTGHSNSATTWKDLSGNGNDGVITGGTWENNSLKFTTSNKNNGVKTADNFPIDFSNTFDITFKLSDVSSVETLFGARTTTTNGFMLFNYNTNNALTLDTKGSSTRVVLGDRLVENKTYNVTVTFSGTTVKLYVNGQLAKTTSFTDASINFPLTIFTAGTRSNSLGDIYSVRVYDRALGDGEVMQNYNLDKARYGF